MAKSLKKDSMNESNNKLMKFISETKEGKFTNKKPDLTHIIYKQLVIQEQDKQNFIENEVLLFGVSY